MNNDFPRMNIDTRLLIEKVEVLLLEARENHLDFGAVNWGDLHIVDIEYRLSMLDRSAQPQCVVRIEEAAPDSRLAFWLTGQLGEFPGTIVECEW